jgi:hypothetical protein
MSFEPVKIADGNWQVRAVSPAGEVVYVSGFGSEAEVEAWMASNERTEWLRKQGWQNWDWEPPKSN